MLAKEERLYPSAEAVPTHVPAELVFDYDLYATKVVDARFHEAMLKLRDVAPPIFWTPRNGGHWVMTRGADVRAVLNDASLFSSKFARVPLSANVNPPQYPIQADPPQHLKFRKILMPAMTPKSVRRLADGARETTIDLIEGFLRDGECDFVNAFAQKLPIFVFLNMVELPLEDRTTLLSFAHKISRPKVPTDRLEGWRALGDYAVAKVRERQGGSGTDLISEIGRVRIDGDLLDDDAVRGLVTLLLLAGLDTVASMLSFFVWYLTHNPDIRKMLVEDPDLIPSATEELLRRLPIANLTRCVSRDVMFSGVDLKEGDLVIASTVFENLDNELFGHALDFDLERKKERHGTFGGGPHNCIGSMLARAELEIFLQEWLARIPEWEIKPGTELNVRVSGTAFITELPLIWDNSRFVPSVHG